MELNLTTKPEPELTKIRIFVNHLHHKIKAPLLSENGDLAFAV
jgi:hypothetical protein